MLATGGNNMNGMAAEIRPGRRSAWRYIRMNKYLYLMLIPVLAWYLAFCYLPMYGIVIAFQKYSFRYGVFGSTFVGLENFKKLFNDPSFINALRNTVVINSLRIVFGFPIPILFALMLNEVRHSAFKKVVQTVTYLPHFISWVAFAGMMVSILSIEDGILNMVRLRLGLPKLNYLMDGGIMRGVVILTDVWKEMGWNTIIYLAAISAIDPTLYEAATVDGAGRLRSMGYITLPAIASTMVIMLILQIGNIMQVGFDQIYNLYRPTTYAKIDILDTYIIRTMTGSANYGLQGAASLIKSITSMALLLAANYGVRLFGREGIY